MAQHSKRLTTFASAVAGVVCLLQTEALPVGAKVVASRGTKQSVGVSLTLRREIPFEYPFLMPQDYSWLMERVIALHPGGKRAAVLLPTEKKPVLQARPESDAPERRFLLAWVDLASGDISLTRELSFVSNQKNFGFSLSVSGDLLCVIADRKVMVLDEAFSTVDWTYAELTGPNGEKRLATDCKFVPGTSAVLVRYDSIVGPVAFWDLQTSLLEWNWKERRASVFHWTEYVSDAIPLLENRVILYRRLPNWANRFRLEDRNLRTEEVLGAIDFQSFGDTRLVITADRIGTVEHLLAGTGDEACERYEGPLPQGFHDSGKGTLKLRPELIVRSRRDPQCEALLPLTGQVSILDRALTQRVTEFRMGGYVLYWPLSVSNDESWIAVRAVDFSYVEKNLALGWDSNRFVIFSLNGSKRRLYTSEKFGPGEAITGFALTPDDKTLVVATSRRLLIYDVEATPAN